MIRTFFTAMARGSILVLLLATGTACAATILIEDLNEVNHSDGSNWRASGRDATASSTAKTISSMPAYAWYHGCGPTAAASVLGYWDLSGYSRLFDADESDVFFTANVKDQISSPAHNAKYDPSPDAPGPIPPFTSIADWFRTSIDPLSIGASYLAHADDAFEGYAGFRGYGFDAENRALGIESSATTFTWSDFVAEIDVNRPLMFLIDSDGNGTADHFVPALGYDDRGPLGKFYAAYSTWSENETIIWQPFQGVGHRWGVGWATFLRPIPEPSSLLIFYASLATFAAMPRRLRRTTSRSDCFQAAPFGPPVACAGKRWSEPITSLR